MRRCLCSLTAYTLTAAVCAGVGCADPAAGRQPDDPIRLAWQEGDVAGITPIRSADGAATIGFVTYHQRRHGDLLDMVRVARFADGSSDEDRAEARAADTLEALRGRSIIRDAHGEPIVDILIDVVGGRISGFYVDGGVRKMVDERRVLPRATYWGPLIFIALKNFDENASGDRLVFNTVAPTPKPRVLNLELVRRGTVTLQRTGGRVDTIQFALRPTINWLIDPIIQRIAPETAFFVDGGQPPALARFVGPRNFAGERMRLE